MQFGTPPPGCGTMPAQTWILAIIIEARVPLCHCTREALFGNAAGTVILGIAHRQYSHRAVVPAEVREELGKEFD